MLGLIAAGCNREQPPEGQVIAIVNGEEITAAELNEEARARSLPIGSDRSTRDQLVQELIDRKLLVQAAREQELDRSPQHLLTARRLSELALAQQLLAARSAGTAPPSPEQLASLIKTRPLAFAQRFHVSVDRINISGPVPSPVAQALNAASSVDQMSQIATAAALSPARATETWDSGTLPDALGKRLATLRPGASFAFVQPAGTVAGQILSTSPQPVPENQRIQVARAMLQQQADQAGLQSLAAQLRAKASVRVQAEFTAGPPAK